jgi:PTS system mannose-specific IIB component
MLIEALASRPNAKSAQELASSLVTVGKDGVKVKPESLAPAGAAAAAAPVAAGVSGSIPEGTVLGDGHIKFVLVRVDTRLLHGQVATTWTKQTSPDRIIVVSDGVAHDDLRKSMIVEAAPPGVHVNVVPVDKMIAVAKDPRFGATKAMVLFETPQDLLRAVEGGVDIKKVNLGSMAHSVGKVVCSNAIAMGPDDVKTLEALKAKGIEFDVRKVPADSPESFDAMLKKAKTELAAAK